MKLGEAILYLSTDNSDLEAGLEDAEDKAAQSHSKMGGLLTGITQGIGQSIVGLVGNAAGAVIGLGKEALDSYANYERLAASLQSLVARELIANSGTEKYIKLGTTKLELSEKERQKLAELELQQRKLNDQIAIGEQNLAEATARGKESAAELDLRQVRLIEMRAKLAALTGEIEKLHDKDGKLVDVTKRVVEGQMSMTEAMAQAGPRAKELLGWIEKLAVNSPFSQDEVAGAFRLAMAYGFTSEEAQGLTQTMIDFVAGSGQSGAVMGQIALALGQIRAQGKVAGGEIMQLTNAGVPVREILAEAFGVTTAQLQKMVEQGMVPADKAIKAITEALNRDFGGAAQAQANTFAGLIASLQDIKSIGLRELFAGTFQAIQPYLVGVVGVLSSPEIRERIAAFGDVMGQKVAEGLRSVAGIVATFQAEGIRAALLALGIPPWVIKAWEVGVQHLTALKGALTGILIAIAVATAITSVASAIAALTSPIGLVMLAVAVLGAAWAENWGGIQEKTATVVEFLKGAFDGLVWAVAGVWASIQAFWAWITSIATGTMELAIKAPEWITTLVAWMWPALFGAPLWITGLVAWLWPKVEEQPEWVKTLMSWLWPKVEEQPGWVKTLMDWIWPTFPNRPQWLQDLLNWVWPSLPALPSWLGGGGGETVEGSSVSNAAEYALFPRGGRLAPVLAGAGAGGRVFNITINVGSLGNQQDVRRLGQTLVDTIERTERYG